MPAPLLALEQISKRFGAIVVAERLDLPTLHFVNRQALMLAPRASAKAWAAPGSSSFSISAPSMPTRPPISTTRS